MARPMELRKAELRGKPSCLWPDRQTGGHGQTGIAISVTVIVICRRRLEMSPCVQSRDDTPGRRTHREQNGMSAKRWVRARGSRAEAGLPVRAAQPLRPSPSPSILSEP
jgi:hypothetical protein